MRAVVQRVSEASVHVGGVELGRIGKGLLILVGVRHGATAAEARQLADKCLNLRIFEDEQGKFNRSLLDVRGEVLAVSQFTLYGDASHGRRPSFIEAAPPELANALYETFVAALRRSGLGVQTGVFGAHMAVYLVNDGPVTLMLERDAGPAAGGSAPACGSPPRAPMDC